MHRAPQCLPEKDSARHQDIYVNLGLATCLYPVTSRSCAPFKMVFWKDPQFAVWDHEHHPMFNEGSALAPGQLVSFTSSFILKRNLCPYYLTSSSVAVNYIKADFPKLRNFRIYFVACCYGESLLGIRAPACQGCRAGQIPAISVTPHRHHSCETETPLQLEAALIPEHLPKEWAEPLSAAQDTGQPHCSPRRGEAGCDLLSPGSDQWAQGRGAAHLLSTNN